MNTNIQAYINNTIAYIEENIKGELSLELISKELFLSRFHLERIFAAVTGNTLMRYISGRKLTSSLRQLIDTDKRIIDIAGEYGYGYEQSYIRAFKRRFGITPEGFRKTRCELVVTDKISLESLLAVGEKAVLIKPVTVVKPAFCIVGKQRYASHNTDDSQMAADFIRNDIKTIPNAVNSTVFYGHVRYDGANDYYTAGTEVASKTPPPNGLVSVLIPSNQYWVFKYIGLHPAGISYADFLPVEEAANKWFALNGLSVSHIYHFEKIDLRRFIADYCELELYFPINM